MQISRFQLFSHTGIFCCVDWFLSRGVTKFCKARKVENKKSARICSQKQVVCFKRECNLSKQVNKSVFTLGKQMVTITQSVRASAVKLQICWEVKIRTPRIVVCLFVTVLLQTMSDDVV